MRFDLACSKWFSAMLCALFWMSAAVGASVLEEDFEGTFPPAGWSTVDDSAPPLDCAWKRSDEYILDDMGPASLGAAADSDACAPADAEPGDVDTSLFSPEMDLTGSIDTILSFDLAYRDDMNSAVTLDVSTDGGDNWTTLETYDSGPPWGPFHPQTQIIDFSAYDGESSVILRWRYTAGIRWWVFIDNVTVAPIGPGVLDINPGMLDFGASHTGIQQLMEVSVSNAANPGDESLELAGIEIIGDPEFELAGGGCQAGVTVLEPGESCIQRVRFTPSTAAAFSGQLEVISDDGQTDTVSLQGTGLPTSMIEIDPEAFSLTLDIGQTTDETLSIVNLGTDALEWEIPLIHGPTGAFSDRGMSGGDLLRQGVLLVHNLGRNAIMALDPQTGDVIDADFILTGDLGFGSKPKILMHPDGERLLVTQQTNPSVVHSFDSEGNYLGVFAPAGGEDISIMQNIRGMAFHPDSGHLLVASAPFSGAPHAVVEFDLEGNFLGEFINMGANGLSSPWAIEFREQDMLLSASNDVHMFEHDGTYIDPFNTVTMNFVQQVVEIGNGNVLVTSSQGGVWEFDAQGTHLGNHTQYQSVSGVHQLPGGNLLVSANTGVHEIDMQGNIVRDILGGASNMFSLVKSVDCTVPDWMTISPTSGTVAAGGSPDEVVITFDASDLDPGIHEEVFCIESNDPTQPRLQVPVTIEVMQPADFGTIQGVVESNGYCGAETTVLQGATVQAVGSGGQTITRTTGENGAYSFSVPETESPFSITVSASGHLNGSAASVSVGGGQTVTESFGLDLDAPCMTVAEESFHFDVTLGDGATSALTLDNLDGAGSLNWTINEGPGLAAHTDPRAHFPAQPRYVEHTQNPDATAGLNTERPAYDLTEGDLGPRSDFQVPAYTTTASGSQPGYITLDALAPQSLTVINPNQPTTFYAGTFIRNDFDNHYVLASAGGSSTLNTFGRVDTATGQLTTLGSVTGVPAVSGWNSMKWDHTTGMLYAVGNWDELYSIDPDTLEASFIGNIGGPGVHPDGALIVAIAISPEGLMYALDLVDNVLLAVDKTSAEAAVIGDVGLDANFAQDMDFDHTTGTLYWAAYNNTTSQIRTVNTETGATAPIGDVQAGTELLSFTIARPGGGCSTPEDISWLSVSSTSGATAAHSIDQVDVVINTDGLAHGSYEAFLCVASDDPVNSLVWVPVSMDVTDPDAGTIEGTVSSAGHCSQEVQPLAGALVTIDGSSGTYQVTTDSAGFYSVVINDGESPADITVSASGHLDATVSGVVIEADVTTTQDVELSLQAPCFTVESDSIEAEVGPDGSATRILTIGNKDGAMDLEWTLDMATRLDLPATALQNPVNVRAGNGSLTAGTGIPAQTTSNPVLLGDMQMSQTTDTNIVPGNSIGCPLGANHSMRRFYFDEHPGVGNRINSVDVGVQDASGTGVVTVNLYTVPSSEPVDTIPQDSLELIGAAVAPVSGADNGMIVNVPVTGTVPDITAFDLVVEVASSGAFYIGATNSGETHPGFVMAPGCGFNEPTRVDEIEGFETTHIIQVVNMASGGGCAPPDDVPWLSVDPVAGTTLAGATSDLTVSFDAGGLAIGDYEALICVNGNDPVNERIEVPVELRVLEQAPAQLTVDPASLDFGELFIGATSTMWFDVQNTGEAGADDLTLSSIAASGDQQFTISGGSCAVGTEIEAGGSCTVEVDFAPDSVGSFVGAVTIGANGQTATVTLDGSGIVEPADEIFSDRFETAGEE